MLPTLAGPVPGRQARFYRACRKRRNRWLLARRENKGRLGPDTGLGLFSYPARHLDYRAGDFLNAEIPNVWGRGVMAIHRAAAP